jgi:hypothetical protein
LLLGMCAWNHWMYGSWNPAAAYQSSTFAHYASTGGLGLTNQLGIFFAPDRGLFVWTPALLTLAPAIVRSWRGLPDWSRLLVVAGLAYTVLQCVLDDYDGGFGFYGYRLGLEMLACATPAAAISAARMGSVARRLLGPLLALQVFAIGIGAAVDTSALLGPPESWHDNEFIHLMSQVGLAAYPLVIAVAAVGVWVQKLWVTSQSTAAVDERALSPSP